VNALERLVEPLVIRGVTVPSRIVMSPLAGYTDAPFRRITAEVGARVLFAEMIKARALVFGSRRTREYFVKRAGEEFFAVQLLGRDPEDMRKAAYVLSQEEGFMWLDINMGCPVRKVVAELAGAEMMRDLPAAAAVIEAVRRIHPGILSVKMRAGWSPGTKNALELAKLAEACGADLVTVHGRTREEWYSGPVDLDLIARIKATLKVPVMGNGGLTGLAAVREMIEKTNVDGVMIARGALGNPWLFPQLEHAARTGEAPPPAPLEVRREVFFRHIDYLGEYYGEEKAVPLARKFGVLYFKGVKDGAAFRRFLYERKDFASIRALVRELCRETARPPGAAAP